MGVTDDTELTTLLLTREQDIVPVRQQARELAGLIGFEGQDQIRIATTVSELARNAIQYAGGGNAIFSVGERPIHGRTFPVLLIRVQDQGPGIAQLNDVLSGTYKSSTGMGVGLSGAKRLMDVFHLETGRDGTTVTIGKIIPQPGPGQAPLSPAKLAKIRETLATLRTADPFLELQRQNQELIAAFRQMEQQRQEVIQLNRELEETNRGVVALYAELDQRADYLKRASELKSQFLSNITHEFRTPLNSIRSISTMLLDRMDGELNEEQEKQVLYIKTGAETLSSLVNDLLDMAKIEAGKLSVRVTTFHLGDVFGMLRGMLKPLLEKNSSIRLVFEDPDDTIPPLVSDEEKISQILRNFISNGLKYTERGEVRIAVTRHGQSRVRFTVTDTGIGIAKENLDRIFEEFVQVEGQHQRTKGTGLGLPLAKKLATLLGGYVDVASTPGIGSEFSLVVPIGYRGEEDAQLIVEDSVLPPPRNGQPCILIVDDNEADRYVLKKLLGRFDADLFEASSGESGLAMARHLHPDCIVIDLSMPGMNGFELLDAFKRDPVLSGIPIIVSTSKILKDDDMANLEDAHLVLSKNEILEEHTFTALQGVLKIHNILPADRHDNGMP